jgi:hypothetical protein
MYTDERIHAYCRSAGIQNNNDILKPIQLPNSSQVVLNDFVRNQLNDEIINLFTSYWEGMFDSIKLTNRYWRRKFNIGKLDQNIS